MICGPIRVSPRYPWHPPRREKARSAIVQPRRAIDAPASMIYRENCHAYCLDEIPGPPSSWRAGDRIGGDHPTILRLRPAAYCCPRGRIGLVLAWPQDFEVPFRGETITRGRPAISAHKGVVVPTGNTRPDAPISHIFSPRYSSSGPQIRGLGLATFSSPDHGKKNRGQHFR